MKEFDNDKKRIAAKRFIDITATYSIFFLFSIALYCIDAFEANIYVYLAFWLLNLVLIYISYKKNTQYKIYRTIDVLLFAPASFGVVLLILFK